MTRGEPRPVHITLIATSSHLSAGVYVLKFQAVIPRITPGAPRALKSLRRLNRRSFSLAGVVGGTWAVSVVRFSRPRSTLGRSPCRGIVQLRGRHS